MGLRKKRGVLVTFEGTEGGGKSTQIQNAVRTLRKKGYQTLVLREPGGTQVSEQIRKVILDPKNKKMEQETELLLYLAARAQIIREKIEPALKAGKVVICDRFEDSTLAYQGYGRGISLSSIEKVSQAFVRGSLKPKLTFLLDIDPKKGMKRGGRHDRMEKQSFDFHRRVRQGFLKLAKKNPRRFMVIDATQDKKTVSSLVKEKLDRVF